MSSIFEYKSYKVFLLELTRAERGLSTRLAEAAECQKSYLSTCLSGKGQLTLDHALGIAEFLELSDSEQEYFFLLVEKERAGTQKLRRRLDEKIKKLSQEAFKLKHQQINTVVIEAPPSADLNIYYSNWLPTLIHSLSSIPIYQTIPQMAQRAGVSKELVTPTVKQLVDLGLIKKMDDRYIWHSANIHLSDQSPWIANHHTNWRLKAIENGQKRDTEALHYTSIQSLSKDDFEILKKKIAHFIKDFNKVSDPSQPEECFCFSIDFYKA